MKTILIVTALLSTVAFADVSKDKKVMGHDKEHRHVSAEMMDHKHDEAHHGKHDHKAHHPEHDESQPTSIPKKK